jgi:transposase
MLDFLKLFSGIGVVDETASSMAHDGDGSSEHAPSEREGPTLEIEREAKELEDLKRQLREQRELIEEQTRKLEDHTRTIEVQHEEIKKQQDEIERQQREIEERKREIEEQQHEIEKHQQEIEHLKEELRRAQFGPTSEKRRSKKAPAASETPSGDSESTTESPNGGVPAFVSELAGLHHKLNSDRRKKERAKRSENRKRERASRKSALRVREKVVVRPTCDDLCPHCRAKLGKPFRCETTEKTTVVRPAYEVIHMVHHVVKCSGCNAILRAKNDPSDPYRRSQFDATVAAEVMVNKIVEGVPIDRQTHRLKRHGIDVSEDAMNDLFVNGGLLLGSVARANLKETQSDPVLYIDDTTLRYRPSRTSKYRAGSLWMLENPKGDVSVEFAPGQRTTKGCRRILNGVKEGTVVVSDAFSAMDTVAKEKKLVNASCMSHARRYVVKAEISDPELSAEGLQFFQALYAIEAEAAVRGLDATQRQELREEKAVPVLAALLGWMRYVVTTREPDEKISQAAHYMLSRWDKFLVYTTDGRVKIDNNRVESWMKLIARSRKNCLQCARKAVWTGMLCRA